MSGVVKAGAVASPHFLSGVSCRHALSVAVTLGCLPALGLSAHGLPARPPSFALQEPPPGARSPQTSSPAIRLLSMPTQSGLAIWDISAQRAAALPLWAVGQSAAPVATADLVKTAETWLSQREPRLGSLELQTIVLSRIRRGADIWYYQVVFTAEDAPQPNGPLLRAVILSDGSIVEPRFGALAPGTGIGPGTSAAAPTPPGVYRLGPGVTAPRLIHEQRPRYTAEALRAKIEGTVLVECVVGIDGKVGDVRVLRSLDTRYGLDEEAIGAARRWRFEPGTVDGRLVPVLVTIQLDFNLRN